jgi:flagellum-specific peptidoglycan hydrolase FlgJ
MRRESLMSYLTNLKKTLTIIMALVILTGAIITPVSHVAAATTFKVNGYTRRYSGTRSKVYYEGKKISTSTRYGLYINDNFMVPYKKLLVDKGPRMGGNYNRATKVLILSYGNTNIKMKINSRKVYVNGIRKSNLNTPPMNVKMEGRGVVVVPIKRVCAELGLAYSYDSATRKIYIAKKTDGQATNASANTPTVASAANAILQSTAFLSLTQNAFIALLGPLAQQDYHKSGVLASVSLAQAINESGWGRTELAQKGNNIFGMKISLSGNTWAGSVWDGKSYVAIRTTEEYGGKKTKITAKFRKYPSVTHSIADHSAYLVNAMNGSKRRYYGLTSTKSYSEQLNILRKGGYCTWSSYVSELTNLIKKYKLTKYDK